MVHNAKRKLLVSLLIPTLPASGPYLRQLLAMLSVRRQDSVVEPIVGQPLVARQADRAVAKTLPGYSSRGSVSRH